ncbi:hypothetical protein RUND412_005829 [Rhizina undulata]
MSFSAYRKKLEEGIKAGFNYNPDHPLYRSSVLTTWELSFRELSKNARRLLHLCAFLSNEDIPEELFRRGKRAVHWIKTVHAWARESQDTKARRQNAKDTLKLLSSVISDIQDSLSSESSIFQRRILSHLNLCRHHISQSFSGSHTSLTVANASKNIGFAFKELGYYSEAEELLQRALAFWKKWLGKSNIFITLKIVALMASVYLNQGRFNEAVDFLRRALAGFEKLILVGKDHLITLTTMHNIASVYDNQGRYDEALELFQRVLAGEERTLGTEHILTMTTTNNMAYIFCEKGEYEKVLEWYHEVLAVYEKTIGRDHTKTLYTIDNLGIVFNKQGIYDEALEWHGETLRRGGKRHTERIIQ